MTKQEILDKLDELGIYTGKIDEKKFIYWVNNTDSDMYEFTNEDEERGVLVIVRGSGIAIQTYQNNGYIRINEYTIREDENGESFVNVFETFNK